MNLSQFFFKFFSLTFLYLSISSKYIKGRGGVIFQISLTRKPNLILDRYIFWRMFSKIFSRIFFTNFQKVLGVFFPIYIKLSSRIAIILHFAFSEIFAGVKALTFLLFRDKMDFIFDFYRFRRSVDFPFLL